MSINSTLSELRLEAAEMIKAAGIRITEEEIGNIVVNDFELGNVKKEGAQILEWLNTVRVCVRLIALLPFQTLPEHYHRATDDDPGKEETIRMVSGTLYVYIPGEEKIVHGFIPEGREEHYTTRHETIMKDADQLTLEPGTMHWFQAGADGAVMYTFSSQAKDLNNIFTNPLTKKGCINDLL